jgi:hypothetical protein
MSSFLWLADAFVGFEVQLLITFEAQTLGIVLGVLMLTHDVFLLTNFDDFSVVI